MLAVRDALAGIRLILRYILNKSHLEYHIYPSVFLSCFFLLQIGDSHQELAGTSCDEPVRSLSCTCMKATTSVSQI